MKNEATRTTNLKNMFVTLSPIQALSVGLPAINILISSCIIGNTLGSSALASIGFAGPFSYVILIFANLIGIGSQLLCGRYIGEGNRQKLKETFTTTIVLCTVAGLLLALVSFFFSETIAGLLGAGGELATMTADYIRGYFLCSMFTIFSTCALSFLQLDCAKTLSTVSIVVQLVLNIGLNILNAYILHWGMFGVGLASSIASAVSVAVCVPHFVLKSKLFKFSPSDFNKTEVSKIIELGWNSALFFVWLFLRDRIFNQVAFALGGTVVISAFAVANNISNSIGGTIQGSLSGPVNIIASVLVGERDVESLRELPRVAIKTIYPVSIASYILVFILAKPLCLMFGAEIENIETYVLAMRIFNLWFISNPAKTVALGLYNALKNTKAVSLFNFLGMFAYAVIIFIIAQISKSKIILYSFAYMTEVLLILTFIVYYRIATKHRAKSLTKYIYIPRSFSVPKENSFAVSVKNNEEVSAACERIIKFCKEKGMSDKQSFYCGLCFEEMAVDTISKGFPLVKNSNGIIDVRLLYENNEMTIMLRDNCPQFNPTQWLELYAEDDPSRSIGLKMVSEIAKEMEYKSTLKLNVLTIKI